MFELLALPAPRSSRRRDVRLLGAAIQAGPGPVAIRLLDRVDVSALDQSARVDYLAAVEAQTGWLEAWRAEAVVAVAGSDPRVPVEGGVPASRRDLAERSVEAEVGAALRIAPRSAAGRIASARFLAGPARSAVPALVAGHWRYGHLRVAEDELAVVPREVCEAALDAAVPHAATDTPARLRRRLRREVARIDADAIARRIAGAAAQRCASLDAEPDLQGRLTVIAPWSQAAWIHSIADAWARREANTVASPAHHAGSGQGIRTLAALRADAYTEAMRLLAVQMHQHDAGLGSRSTDVVAVAAILRGTGTAIPVPRRQRRGRSWADAIVMLTEATAWGLSDDPGFVPGYGPVPAAVARELLADADQWRSFLTDQRGRLTHVGSERYRPSDRLRELVTARDQTCSFDTCGRPSTDCDLDHVENFDGRNTCDRNLRPPCRTHHRLKTHAGWTTTITPEGLVDWVSPTGHHYPQHADPLWDRGCPLTPIQATGHGPPTPIQATGHGPPAQSPAEAQLRLLITAA